MGAERPPTSGPGSGVQAWREYAAQVTGESAETFGDMSRDDIVELLDKPEHPNVDPAQADRPATASPRPDELAELPDGPHWMVPTDDGWVPERHMQQRRGR